MFHESTSNKPSEGKGAASLLPQLDKLVDAVVINEDAPGVDNPEPDQFLRSIVDDKLFQLARPEDISPRSFAAEQIDVDSIDLNKLELRGDQMEEDYEEKIAQLKKKLDLAEEMNDLDLKHGVLCQLCALKRYLREKGVYPQEIEEMLRGTEFDDELFQPPPIRPDCDICFLPLAFEHSQSYQPCCGKVLCMGCIYAHKAHQRGGKQNCPFCRTPTSGNRHKTIKFIKKRIEASDPNACFMMGVCLFEGSMGLKRDVSEALKLLHRAAELGDHRAHDHLGWMYHNGDGVGKDEKKAMHHWRIAAIGGDLDARCNLAGLAYDAKNIKLAMKHWIIAAEAGHDESLNALKLGYKAGHVTKDAFAKILRAHQSANDEAKSENRDRFVKFHAQNPHLFID